MANFNIYTVREMIDSAFGETESSCPVNFNMVGSVLYILARRMELLKRHFKIEMRQRYAIKSTFAVTEIKIHAKGKKRKRKAARRRPNLPSYKKSARKRSDDSSSETSLEERYTKGSRKPKSDKHSQMKRPAQVYRTEQLIARKYDETSPSEPLRARKYSDEILAVTHRRVQMEKSPASRQQQKPTQRKRDSSETSLSELSKTGKHSDKTTPSERNRTSNVYSPSDELSSESGKSRTTDATRRSMPYAGLFIREKEDHYRKSSDNEYIETQHEKIYIVSAILTPSGGNKRTRDPTDPTAILNPVVTQEQYNRLLAKIRKLEKKFGITTKWNDLTKTTSMTHPKAALNISVRLDRAENRLARLLDIVTQLASQIPERDLQALINEIPSSGNEPKSFKLSDPQSGPTSELPGTLDTDQTFQYGGQAFESSQGGQVLLPTKPPANVTHPEMKDELERAEAAIERMLEQAISRGKFDRCGQALGGNDTRVNIIQKRFRDISALHYKIEKCGRETACVDERISTQVAMFQDNLLLMQVELETALDKVTDSLMSPKEDAAAVAQTVEVFLEYKSDLVHTRVIQLDLNTDMEKYLTDLGFIMKKIEYLRNRKCTRQQMFEALGDKLTLKDINGLLTQAQFGAVTTNNREVLQNVNMKIFSKECDWQYAIDTFVTKSSSCADILQLKSFSDSIQQVFGEIDVDLNEMFKIATPFKTYATNKTIQRDEKCLSCGAPVEVEKTELNLKLWQELVSTAAVPAKKSITLKYEDMADLCIPGLPIPHPLEQGSYICQHDCGEIVKTEESLELYIRKLKPDAQPHIKAVPEKVNNKTQTEYR